MKKLFVTIITVMCAALNSMAATVDDIVPCKRSYILVMDYATNNGTEKPGKGELFGNNHFLDVTGGTVATNKGTVDLGNAEEIDSLTYEGFSARWGKNGSHMNSFRLKKAQDVIATKVTAGSKIYVFGQNHGSRHAKFARDARMNDVLEGTGAAGSIIATYTATEDELVYIGSEGGDYYISFIVVEVVEIDGTPVVEKSDQTYENGLWFFDVTATPKANTCLRYTTDDTNPLDSETALPYTEPIRCYSNQTVLFQAYMASEVEENGYTEEAAIYDATSEAVVYFQFNSPTVTVDDKTVTIVSEYENAKNHYQYDGKEGTGNVINLQSSTTLTVWSTIDNGGHAVFTTSPVTAEVYTMKPISGKKTFVVEKDYDYYYMDFDKDFLYVRNATDFGDDGSYFAYLRMTEAKITFCVKDEVDVTVKTSSRSCKTYYPDEETGAEQDRRNYVYVNGVEYGNEDVSAENGTIIKFRVQPYEGEAKSYYTFAKWPTTGGIAIHSIEFSQVHPDVPTGISEINTEKNLSNIYNLSGQRVDSRFNGIVIKDGKKFVVN